MRRHIAFLLLCSVACSKPGPPPARQFELKGKVISVEPARKLITIDHEEIEGFMMAMTMPYEVKDAALLEGRVPGDVIKATLVVTNDSGVITAMEKTGTAPVTPPALAAASGFELIRPGDEVPDAELIDQDGRTRPLSGFRGTAIVITFIYTRCPLPAFCPLMDRNFVALQRAIAEDPRLKGHVKLVSITIDPAFDKPPILRQHAKKLGADPAIWTFLTGDRDQIDKIGSRFGLMVVREGQRGDDISHSLRTAIVDGSGKLVKVYTGNEWKPSEIVADLGR